jgi:hypothetical protein
MGSRYTAHTYSASEIIRDWREFKGQKGYAAALSIKHGVPPTIIYNVVYQHRKKKSQAHARYRKKTNVKNNKSWFAQNFVIFAGANYTQNNY